MDENLYLVFDKSNLKRNFKNKVALFTLNEFILTNLEKKSYYNIFPDPIKTSLNSKNLIIKTREAKYKIIQNLKSLYLFNRIKDLDELLEPILEIKLSRFYYLEDIIPNYKKYTLLHNRKEIIYDSKFELILAIDSIYCEEKTRPIEFFTKFFKFKYSLYYKILINIQKRLINRLVKSNKKEINFFSDKEAYFIKNLKFKIKNDKNIILYYLPTNSLLRIIFLLIEQFYKCIFNKNIDEIGIFLLPDNKYNFDYLKISKNIKEFFIEDLEKKYSEYLIKQLYFFLLNTLSFKKYLLKIFKTIKIKNAYFHSIRFPDLFALSRVLIDLNNNVNLISHGTHTYQKNNTANKIASISMGIGQSFSNEKRINLLSQSRYCDEYLDSMNFSFKKINRLINGNLKPFRKINSKRRNRKTKILCIGTVKHLGARRYYFESSGEYIAGIHYIYSKLKKYEKDFEIIIRIRDVRYEINKNILNNAIRDKDNLIKISNINSIYDEIKNSDCIISFSSTTLEEGLLMNKPVMCFGLSEYNHFKFYENENINSINNFENKNLRIIEENLGRKFIFKDNIQRKIDYKF